MIFELVYTSAPQGLFQGNTGFSVVACTRNIDMALCRQLEKLSAYTPYYAHYDAHASMNPVNYAHRIIRVNNTEYHILSRICFNGLDYTQRSNKLASHIAISCDELPNFASGPASVFSQEGLFKEESWPIQTGYFEYPPVVLDMQQESRVCATWQQLSGDAGWAGVIAENYLTNPNKNIYVVFNPEKAGKNIALISEVISLLPSHLRWQITFSSYFTELAPGTTCNLRFCTPDSDQLRSARTNSSANIIIDLTMPLSHAQGGDLVELARTGKEKKIVTPATPATPFPVNSASPQFVPQYFPPTEKKNVSAYIAFILLVILGIVFLVTKITDSKKITLLENKNQKLQEITVESITLLHNEMLVNSEFTKKQKISIPSLPNCDSLRDEVKVFLKTKSTDPKKTSKQAVDYFKKVQQKLAELDRVQRTLVALAKDADAQAVLAKNITRFTEINKDIGTILNKELVQNKIDFVPAVDVKVINAKQTLAQQNISELSKLLSDLQKAYPNTKFPIPKKSVVQSVAVCKTIQAPYAWAERQKLVESLSTGKTFEIIIADLPQNAEIAKVYWGKHEMGFDNKVFFIDPAKNDGIKVELNIQLKNGKLSISRKDKDKSNLSKMKLSLTLSTGTAQKIWVDFFFSEQSKIGIEFVGFNIQDNQFSLPVPQDLLNDPELLATINVVLKLGKTETRLERNATAWTFTLDLPTEIKEHIAVIQALESVKKKLFDSIQKDMFSPEIESLSAFTVYNQSKKSSDKVALFAEALKSLKMGSLGIKLPDAIVQYKDRTFSEVMAQERSAIEKQLKERYPAFQFEIKGNNQDGSCSLQTKGVNVICGDEK